MSQVIARLEQWLPRRKLDIFGKDSLIKSSIPYYTLAFLTASALILVSVTNWEFNPFIFISIVYSVFPILDELFSLDERNPTPEERKYLESNDGYFRMTLYAAMILSWAINIKLLINFSQMQIGWGNLFTTFGIIFIFSNLSSVQFAVAHEILHKPGKFYRILGTLHMTNLYYTHFTYHHLNCHHHLVATPQDPTTAKRGENVYHFVYSCVVNSFRGVYSDEKRKGKTFYTNYAVLSILGSLVFAAGVYMIFGLQTLILHSLVVLGAVFYLQSISYIEHYGLLRKRLPNGDYEKVTILHSWNAPHRFTNYLLFKLQRHSDHHENSSKPFQTLVSMEQSPFLPHGYNLMILMSFFPSVWFRIMNPLVDAYQAVDAEKGEKIDPKVMEIALTETRKFLIEIALSAFLPFLLTFIGVL